MTAPIALQLYTLRDSLARDFEGVVRKVAELGYEGVETAGFNGTTPQSAANLFHDLGLQVCSAHGALPLGDRQNEVLDLISLLNCRNLVCAYFPAEEFETRDRIKRVCDQLNQADEVARANGLTFFYHNHWWEYRHRIDNRPAYQIMLEHLSPTVRLEIDTYWVKTGGKDPAAILRELGTRASLLHIKDGSTDESQPMVAVGEGIMDWPSVMAESKAEWLIVELDRCATDMMEAVGKSYEYLISKGYARGRNT
jgi:sugar phosphate isomerase/epimerase